MQEYGLDEAGVLGAIADVIAERFEPKCFVGSADFRSALSTKLAAASALEGKTMAIVADAEQTIQRTNALVVWFTSGALTGAMRGESA
jgi:hypothetical protein